MTKKKILKATHGSARTPLSIGKLKLPCYVLEDGKRVLSGRGIQLALGFSPRGSGQELLKLVQNPDIKHFLTPEVIDNFNNRIEFLRPGGGGSAPLTYGYEATILIDICNAIIEANNAGRIDAIRYSDAIIQSDIILRSVAKVGIIALIDEATGYQYDRDRDALNKILEAYIAKEFLPWTKRFPDEFYRQIFRLKGWIYNPLSVSRPSYVGKLTNKLVYDQLPDGVLEELKTKTPKSTKGNYIKRFHQSLTEDVGQIHLDKHLASIITLMRISPNWRTFESHFNRAFGGQLSLDEDVISNNK